MNLEQLVFIPSTLSVLEQRALIAERLHLFGTATHLLKRKSNDLVPISRLPTELLVMIFASIPSIPNKQGLRALSQSVLARDGTMSPPWASASRVCSGWRTLVTSSRILAANIDAAYGVERWAHVQAERAQGSPLALRMTQMVNFTTASSFLGFLLPRRTQIAQLTLAYTAAPWNVLTAISNESNTEYCLSQLHSLELVGPRGAYQTLRTALIPEILPVLRHLKLYNVVLNSAFPRALLARIVTLSCTYDVAHVGAVSLHELLGHISHARNVEILHLRLGEPTNGAREEDTEHLKGITVTLPRLRTLELEVYGGLLLAVIATFATPSIYTMRLRWGSWTELEPDLHRLFHILRFGSLRLYRVSTRTIGDTSWFTWCSSNRTTQLSLVLLSCTKDWTYEVMQASAATADGNQLRSLHVSSILRRDWVGRSPQLPTFLSSLTRLSLACSSGQLLPDVLDDPGVIPSLESLTLSGPGYWTVVEAIVQWLDQRHAVGGRSMVPSTIAVHGYDREADKELKVGEHELKMVIVALLSHYRGDDFVFLWDWSRIGIWQTHS